MKKYILFILCLVPVIITAQPKYSGISTGAFSRMGFGARGIGMGNAMVSVTEGALVSYYNPAVSAFQTDNLVQTGYSFLSLDRSLNFLSYTRKINIYSSKDTSADRKPRSTAGISAGIINSGVSDIQEADNSGGKGDMLSTSENQFFFAFAIRFSEKVAAGVGLKFYYNKLYEEISATGVGIDVGLVYMVNQYWNIAFVMQDLNSKYKWDTTPIYEQEGLNSEVKFPVLKKLGVSYRNPELRLLASAEFEGRNSETNIVRAGVEYNIIDELYLRAGIDQWNISNSDFPAKPAAGFSYFLNWNNIRLGVDYAFMVEQYSPQDRHVIGLNFRF